MDRTAIPRVLKIPSQARSKEKVARILTAAREIIARDGMRALTTNLIAERSGVTVGSIYQYFSNKEAIAYDVFSDWLDEAYNDYLFYAEKFMNESDPIKYFTDMFLIALRESSDEGDMFTQIQIAAYNNNQIYYLKKMHISRMCKKIIQDSKRFNLNSDYDGIEIDMRFQFLLLYETQKIISQSSNEEKSRYVDLSINIVKKLTSLYI